MYVELWRRKLNTAPSVWAAATAAAAAAKKKEKKIRKKTVSVLSFNVTHDVKQSESSTAPSSSSSTSSNRYSYRETPVYLTILDECLSAKTEAEAAAKRPPPLPLPPSRPNPARLRSLKPAPSTLYPTHPPVRFEDHIEVKGVCLDESTAALMIDIENQNSFDDVIFFRSLAEKDLPTSTDAGHRSWLLGFISWYSSSLLSNHDRGSLILIHNLFLFHSLLSCHNHNQLPSFLFLSFSLSSLFALPFLLPCEVLEACHVVCDVFLLQSTRLNPQALSFSFIYHVHRSSFICISLALLVPSILYSTDFSSDLAPLSIIVSPTVIIITM